ncbi:arsenic resistance N-acetyltransferase ArsN2 [Paraburkholderia strydomiana]|uniref:Arsenic resistance N-acetyltransferase ArsN2 n=1 Tax=Paraburkholderia strydomiana TaxID=1245417 RepID=A0ABW9BX83_9BURK
MKIRAATSNDLDAIKTLLVESDLPSSDVTAELLNGFFVVQNEKGVLVGSVGLERFGHKALLRSLVVTTAARDIGLARSSVACAEDLARESGISELWLLTTTATEFFRKSRYVAVDRAAVPVEVQASTQFSTLCPSSAACMKKAL